MIILSDGTQKMSARQISLGAGLTLSETSDGLPLIVASGSGITQAQADARYALLGGSNATGTWGISISGNAASASAVAWSGVTSTPTTIAGYGFTVDFNAKGDARWLGLTATAAKATVLATPRTIAGVSFDGSGNIAIPFGNLASRPSTIGGYGITDFDSLGDARWLLKTGGALSGSLDIGDITGISAAELRVGGDIRSSGVIYATDFVLVGSAPGGGGGATGGVLIQDEGVQQGAGQVDTLNFVGAGISSSVAGGVATITVTATGSGNVTSVFGRTGDVVAVAGDYTWTQIGAKPTQITGFASDAVDLNRLGAQGTGGVLDWNDPTNARPGAGATLLQGNATNGPTGATGYFHSFGLEYATKNATGNVTQFAIPYGDDVTRGMFIRGKYASAWTAWKRFAFWTDLTWTNITGKPTLMVQNGRTTADVNTLLSSGTYGLDASNANSPGGYRTLIVGNNSDVGVQIAGGYQSDSLSFRGWYNSGANFTAWRDILHSGNYSSYARPIGPTVILSGNANPYVQFNDGTYIAYWQMASGNMALYHNGSNRINVPAAGGVQSYGQFDFLLSDGSAYIMRANNAGNVQMYGILNVTGTGAAQQLFATSAAGAATANYWSWYSGGGGRVGYIGFGGGTGTGATLYVNNDTGGITIQTNGGVSVAEFNTTNVTVRYPISMTANIVTNAHHIVVNSGIIGYDLETFAFQGATVGHYGLTWQNTTYGSASGPSALLGGYGGVSLFTAGTERLRISPTGTTYIMGTAAWTYGGFNVEGSAGGYTGTFYNFAAGNTVGGMFDSAGNGGDYDATTGWHFYWNRAQGCLGLGGSTTAAGYRAYVNGALYINGTSTGSDFILSSDSRLKADLTVIQSALTKLDKLSGYTYTLKADTTKRRRAGMVAQELREVLPEAVYETPDGMLAVAYDQVIPLLIEAIKELRIELKEHTHVV